MPLDPKLTKFTTASQAIASYSYTDIVKGFTTETYYGLETEDSAAKDYHLTDSSAIRSDIVQQTATIDQGTFTKEFDLDFDTSTLTEPRTLKGTVTLNVPIAIQHNGAGSSYVYIIAKLRKYDGSTETDIANATSKTNSNGATGGDPLHYWVSWSFDVTETVVESGSVIRLTLEYWAKEDANTGDLYIAHDPTDRNKSGEWFTLGSQIQINLPFKIEV